MVPLLSLVSRYGLWLSALILIPFPVNPCCCGPCCYKLILRWMVMRKAPRYATGACHKGVLISRADCITNSRLAPSVKISWSPFSTLLPRQDIGCLPLIFKINSVSFSMLASAGPMLNYCQLDLGNTHISEISIKNHYGLYSMKWVWKCSLQHINHVCPGPNVSISALGT